MTKYLVGGAKEFYIYLDGTLRPDPTLLFLESTKIKSRPGKDYFSQATILRNMQALRSEASRLPNTVHHDARADDHALGFMKISLEWHIRPSYPCLMVAGPHCSLHRVLHKMRGIRRIQRIRRIRQIRRAAQIPRIRPRDVLQKWVLHCSMSNDDGNSVFIIDPWSLPASHLLPAKRQSFILPILDIEPLNACPTIVEQPQNRCVRLGSDLRDIP
jgi:hypothetical protein